MSKYYLYVLSAVSLVSCVNLDKLNEVGRTPNFKESEVVDASELYPRTKKDIPAFIKNNYEKESNNLNNASAQANNLSSLWSTENREFFTKNNYKKVGDIIKVKIQISDKADLNNTTATSRNAREDSKAPNLLGFEERLKKMLPPNLNLNQLIAMTGANNNSGNGKISRKEDVNAQIAAMVTNVLPNGNLVIQGSQEIRVNYEIRELTIQGIVNPKDLNPDNNINLEQIAEARISYGGRGAISNVQQPRIGVQIIDAVSPF